jgi:hypothetical protein
MFDELMNPSMLCGTTRNSALLRFKIIEDYVTFVLAVNLDSGQTHILDKKDVVELLNVSLLPSVVKISISHTFDVQNKASITSLRYVHVYKYIICFLII